MTEKEAIKVINTEMSCVIRNDGTHCDRKCESCDLVLSVQEILDAYRIAISALEKQDVPDTNVGDMVSRQSAIDTNGLDEEIRCEMCKNPMHTDRGCDGNCKYDEKLYEKIMQILYERIKPLPSAEPEQKWIPCKTGILPEKRDEFYQATYLLDDGDRMVDYVYFNSKGMWSNYAYEYSELLAWMPLPEAYKGDK